MIVGVVTDYEGKGGGFGKLDTYLESNGAKVVKCTKDLMVASASAAKLPLCFLVSPVPVCYRL